MSDRNTSGRGARLLAIGDSWQYTGLTKSLATELTGLQHQVFADDEDAFCANGKTLKTLACHDLEGLANYVANLEGSARAPHAVLLSGGGNDIVQRNVKDYRATRLFRLLRNGSDASRRPPDADLVHDFIDVELKGYYRAVLAALTAVTRVPVLVHGYDHPIPDGRKLSIPFGPGPWLKPVFDAAGTDPDIGVRREIMKILIDRLNHMVAQVAQEFAGRVHHLGFAGILERQPGFAHDYRLYWANELHATAKGYAVLANVVHRKLAELGIMQ